MQYPLTLPLYVQIHSSTIHLYLKTWQAHWNVVGPNFYQLHNLFSDQYNELAEAVDRIAEHARVLQIKAPGALNLISEFSVLEDTQFNGSDTEILNKLLNDNQRLIDLLNQSIVAATKENLQATLNILQDRVEAHGKNVWMLRSQIS